MRLFCFGLGFSAAHLALRLQDRGFEIAGTSRSLDSARERLRSYPGSDAWSLFEFSADAPLADPERALAGTTHLLLSIRPNEAGDPVLRWHAELLDAFPRTQLRWIGYLSTTGVYGDHGGAWIDEDTPRSPTKARTRHRLAAEDTWLERGARVFRLAGIYGPGRSALERVQSGKARRVIKPGKFFNRIHVEDIAATLDASIQLEAKLESRPTQGRAYSVADGSPCSSAEVIEYAAELLGVEPPPALPFEEAEMSPMARSFWSDNIRVANTRIREELGVELRYPDYRAGLDACLAAVATAPDS